MKTTTYARGLSATLIALALIFACTDSFGIAQGPSASIFVMTAGCGSAVGNWYSTACPDDHIAPTNKVGIVGVGREYAMTLVATAGGYICPGMPNPGTVQVTIDPPDAIEPLDLINLAGERVMVFYNVKKSGTITIIATGSGDCPGCMSSGTAVATATIPIDAGDSDGDENSGCGGCQGPGASLGSGSAYNNSTDFRLRLGPVTTDQDGGFIWLKALAPSTAMATPSALTLAFPHPNVSVKTSGTAVRQVKVPQGLVDVVTINSFKYEMRCYYDQDVARDGSGNYVLDSNGYFTLNSGAATFTTWTVENPDASSSVYNRLNITEARGGDDRQFAFTYTASNKQWDLLKPTGHTVSTWKAADSGNSNITNSYKQITVGSQVLNKTQTTTEYVSAITNVLTKQVIEGDGTVTRTTTSTYYPSTAPVGSPYKLQRVDYPDGRWTYYKYDEKGRKTNEFAGYCNSGPPTSGEPSLQANPYRLTEYFYKLDATEDGTGDNGDPDDPTSVRKTTVKLPAFVGTAWELHEVSRTYRITGGLSDNTPTLTEAERCPDPGTHWGDSRNLITYSKDCPYDSYEPFKAFRPLFRTSEDGTCTLYDYAWDSTGFTVIEQTGAPDNASSPSSILDGFQTTTLYDELGHVKSRTTRLIVDGSTTTTIASQQSWVYKDSSGNYFDPLRGSYDSYDLGHRTNSVRYNCCGLASSTNEDRLAITNDYDAMKREVAITRLVNGTNGIKTTNILDALGRVLVTKRIGSDGTAITLAQNQYDVLGQIARQTNALGGVTVITNRIIDNRLYITNTYPDGATKIETFYRDGRSESVSGTAVAPVHYYYAAEQDGSGGPWREYTLEVRLDSSGGTNEWTKTYTDGVGRNYKTVYASSSTPHPYRELTFNNRGQLVKERDPDGVLTLYAYNARGERVRSVVDMNQNGEIDETDGNTGSDDDRITDTVPDVLASGATGNSRGTDIRRTRVFKFTTMDLNATNLISTLDQSTDGLKSWQVTQKDSSTAVITSNLSIYVGNGFRTNITVQPNGASNVTVYYLGRQQSTTQKDSAGNQLLRTTYTYDAHGRVSSTTDARNGATTFAYDNADNITITTSPNVGLGSQVTTTTHDSMGRATNVVQPDSTTIASEYFMTGLLEKTYGSRTYPVEYTYDAQSRIKTMKTWQSFAASSGTAITTWTYDAYRGFLSSKDYCNATTGAATSDAGSADPNYVYTAAGRLYQRVWLRGVTTTYSYNHAGDLSTISYSDSTSGVTYNYDRRGRKTGVLCNSITTAFTYNDADQPLTESYSGGTLGGLSMNNVYDDLLRRTTVEAKNGSTVLQGAGYSYDAANRLQTVTDNSASSYTVTYGYEANSALASTITSKQSTTTRLVSTKTYDRLNLLTSISSVASGSAAPSLPTSFEYGYNAANQRIRATLEDGSFWVYGYDTLGQVISGRKYWADGTAVDGQQFEYDFDDIGNRTSTAGRASAASTYTANKLNQYTQRSVAGYLDVLGVANPTASVTVNGNTANRHGEYFHYPLSVANSSAAYPDVTVASTYGSGQSQTGKAYVPPATESFTYDSDGNVTADGRWTYTWDGENRLTQMIRDTASPTGARQKLAFEYDFQGRRIRKKFYTYSSGWVLQADTVFLYDGWNLVAEMDGNNGNAKLRTYIWGTDLSGSMQGAGGIAGLLKVTDYVVSTTHHFVAYDGNGNIAALTDAATAAITARYGYGPFAEPLRAVGGMARKMPFRFSTKYTDNETGLLYYGYRYYNASAGRWVSRDPTEERGALNLYCLVDNSPINEVDPLGRCKIRIRCNPVIELGFITVGWHCGVVGPDGTQYDIGGVGILGSSGGTPIVYPIGTNAPPPVPPPYKEYPVSCGGCCDSIQKCIRHYHDTVKPPPYNALGPNSNTYAHDMLSTCGCSVDPITLPCYTVLRSPKEGGPYTVCPGQTTTPPRAVGWNSGT